MIQAPTSPHHIERLHSLLMDSLRLTARILFSAKVQFDTISCPSRDSAAEEILILGPNWEIEQQGHHNYWPIFRVTRMDALARNLFVVFVQAPIHRFDNAADFIENG